uniref:Uncharacterized protein n=1 Tax=Panagrolaimus superbus TaxID=310955 RepID=A0A914XZW2_9BILA
MNSYKFFIRALYDFQVSEIPQKMHFSVIEDIIVPEKEVSSSRSAIRSSNNVKKTYTTGHGIYSSDDDSSST